jgi:hypothetical protein
MCDYVGVEECAICYSIIHGTNCQLPSQVSTCIDYKDVYTHDSFGILSSFVGPASTAFTQPVYLRGSAPATSPHARYVALYFKQSSIGVIGVDR